MSAEQSSEEFAAPEPSPQRTGRGFGVLLFGQTMSAFGDAFATVAMPLLVLSLTGSAAQMGLVLGVSLAFQLVGGVLAGPIVDGLDRRTVLVVCDVTQFVVVGSIPLLWWTVPAAQDGGLIWVVYLVCALGSMAGSISLVGLRAVMPQVVGRDALVTANGRMITLGEIAYGIGPAVAGLVVAATNEVGALGINALTFGISALAWLFVRPAATGRHDTGNPADTVPISGRLAGLRFMWTQPFLRSLFLLELINKLLVASVTILFIYYLRVDLGSSSTEIGILLSLASGGAVLAALTASRLRAALGTGRTWLFAVAVQGSALAAVSLSGSVWAVAVLAIVFGYGQITAAILGMSIRQERTPDALLGRVSAAALTVFVAAQAVGGVVTGSATSVLPTTTVFIALGVLNLAVAAIGLRTALWREPPAAPRPVHPVDAPTGPPRQLLDGADA